ncbi:alpha/beta fold hydrolase [uncultured Aeromicrobium sp.]|uniref:alpha/beta fold hydrolase n=1 Tax=uncultured Aeromicrobium sp. TaxID=337820 RepID=UPI0025DE560B|nr:alpha/beta hydrolase [uncultured Aeromicrobium sp.]
MARIHTIVIDGLRTRYIEAGDRSRPTLLLIHDGGFGASAELCWSDVIEELEARFHLVAPDLLGWGGSDKVVHFGEAPYPSKIRQVARLVETLDLDEVVSVGTSFGGSLALRAALEPENPWRARGIVSITGAGGLYRIPEGVEAIGSFDPTIEDARRLTSWLVADADAFEEHARQRLENSLVPGHWEAMNAPRLRNPRAERPDVKDPFLDRVAELRLPVLFVEGARDRLLDQGWAKQLADLAPHGEALTMDCGHAPNVELPAELAKVLAMFADRGEDR